MDPGSSAIHILGTGALTARGTMDLEAMTMDGDMDMGPSPAKLALLGTLTMAPGSSSRFRIGKKSNGIWDTLAVTGAAQFDGVLDLRSIPGNDPVAGDTIPIATMGSMTHAFSSVTINGVPAAGWLAVLYSPTVVKVVILKALVGVETGDGPAASAVPRFLPAGSLARPAFALHLPIATRARVVAYDVTGREIAVLAEGLLPAGRHEFALPREGVANGVCFGRALLTGAGEAGRRVLAARVVRVR